MREFFNGAECSFGSRKDDNFTDKKLKFETNGHMFLSPIVSPWRWIHKVWSGWMHSAETCSCNVSSKTRQWGNECLLRGGGWLCNPVWRCYMRGKKALVHFQTYPMDPEKMGHKYQSEQFLITIHGIWDHSYNCSIASSSLPPPAYHLTPLHPKPQKKLGKENHVVQSMPCFPKVPPNKCFTEYPLKC